jgi:glycosyltransferase involved in cell wall biosynthesis
MADSSSRMADRDTERSLPVLSALVIAKDERENIERCLGSLGFCDEIVVVVDASSTDGTAEIARRYTDRVAVEPWRGYSGQKQYALTLCRGLWVFWIDADEAVSPELARAVRTVLGADARAEARTVIRTEDARADTPTHFPTDLPMDAGTDSRIGPGTDAPADSPTVPRTDFPMDPRTGVQPVAAGDVAASGGLSPRPLEGSSAAVPVAYRVRRRVFYLGRWIDHGGWGRDEVVRLFLRDRGRFSERRVHESVEIDGPIGRLPGVLEHHSYRDLAHHWEKIGRLSTLSAEEALAAGRKARFLDFAFRPAARWFKIYVLKRGFLDGWRGWVIAGLAAVYVLLKYAKMREKARPG